MKFLQNSVKKGLLQIKQKTKKSILRLYENSVHTKVVDIVISYNVSLSFAFF